MGGIAVSKNIDNMGDININLITKHTETSTERFKRLNYLDILY